MMKRAKTLMALVTALGAFVAAGAGPFSRGPCDGVPLRGARSRTFPHRHPVRLAHQD